MGSVPTVVLGNCPQPPALTVPEAAASSNLPFGTDPSPPPLTRELRDSGGSQCLSGECHHVI